MDDQAERLREKVKTLEYNKKTKTLAIVSGKGGVGKSNFALNFAISLKKKETPFYYLIWMLGWGILIY